MQNSPFARLKNSVLSRLPWLGASRQTWHCSVAALKEIVAGKAVLVDVRETEELEDGMAEPAVQVSSTDVDAEGPAWKAFLAKYDRSKTLFFYCAAGVRSQRATDRARAAGYKAYNLGGFQQWLDARLPIRKP